MWNINKKIYVFILYLNVIRSFCEVNLIIEMCFLNLKKKIRVKLYDKFWLKVKLLKVD